MASRIYHLLRVFLIVILSEVFFNVVISSTLMYPLTCSNKVQACTSYLYHISRGHKLEQIASLYSVNTSQIKPITHGTKEDYLVSVPCTCQDVRGTSGYFYDTRYSVRSGDTFENITREFYSGQVLKVGGEKEKFVNGSAVTLHLICGCVERESQEVVTYTVQKDDTLSGIAEIISTTVTTIENFNTHLTKDPSYIDVGWVLFVPREKRGTPAPRKNVTSIESEKPVRFSLEEIAEATSQFNGTRKIGEGGYGSVYFGVLGEREVAVKKMKSSKSKEFLAELNVLCKIHHINVVELLGYASGDNHLYVVYEYVRNGSLNEHLHDPLLKGQHPLSWTARAQIALDAARGIEYIHDHTKAHYVHRDIKTSNILLDERLGAKVADFGLAKLVEHSNEKDFIATRLVGTPGYLPPESISELQTTYKTDVFAFGVVLAELITGQRALARDNQEPKKMKSLVSLMYATFHDKDPETAVKANIDVNLRGSYPAEEVQKMAELSRWCLSEDPGYRPEMREVVTTLAQILISSIEWEASLGGSSQVFSGLIHGR
ncbi:leucine-rich repeat protein kinase family protein [Actinidia rufa]|uniref:Leucine-rich repeat protein kinase family protein n=1 Tax=Actinidia rufa TaxID=165716 RepID=A0A7J0H3T3_9ERIC|nr:leucine-rich repeat protein kinase family protein [Actinidia rufa]